MNIKKFISSKNNAIIIVILIIGVVLLTATGGKNSTSNISADEKKLETILSSIDGAGDVKVLITYDYVGGTTHPIPRGAVITADGADNMQVENAVVDASCAALGLPSHKIAVFKSSKR